MKKLSLFIVMTLLLSGVVFAQEKEDGPEISFETEKHDFGDVSQGEKVSHEFKFKNSGNKPLVLSNVLTTCGCTATDWPKDPIAPGKSGTIEVKFNTTNRSGKQNKVVTIISNAKTPQTRIKIIANVVEG